MITFALFFSIMTMENAVNSLRENCVLGITSNEDRTREMVLNSLGIVTILKTALGYKQCAEIARRVSDGEIAPSDCRRRGKVAYSGEVGRAVFV